MSRENIEALKVIILGFATLLFCILLAVCFHDIVFVRAISAGVGGISALLAIVGACKLVPTPIK